MVFLSQENCFFSKGALDVAAALSLYYEELKQHVAAFVSIQGSCL
jgi:hypothetical protein